MTIAGSRPYGKQSGITGVLDVGSFKTACLVVLQEAARPPRVIGVAQVPTKGVKSGTIVDLALAEDTVRRAIAEAEAMSGCRLDWIDATVSCGRLTSVTFKARAKVAEGLVTQSHVVRLADAARQHLDRPGRHILYLRELGHDVDQVPAGRDPVGLSANRLSADFHAVICDSGPLGNLRHVIERCYLAPGEFVPAPLASALGVTSPAERESGVTVIDIGAGVTGVAVFEDGRYIFNDTIAIGGSHVTMDIARALHAPLEEAERIKTVYGTLINALSNQHDVFSYATADHGEGDVHRSTKADLARIIQARVAALFDLVRDRLASAGLADCATGGLVVTGGTSQLPGLPTFAETSFRRPVRVGLPHRVAGLPPMLCTPAFAALVGALDARDASFVRVPKSGPGAAQARGYLGRVGEWLKDGF